MFDVLEIGSPKISLGFFIHADMADPSAPGTSSSSSQQRSERSAKIAELARYARERIARKQIATIGPPSSSVIQSARAQKRHAEPDCRARLDQIASQKRAAVADTSTVVGESSVPRHLLGEGVRSSSAVGEVGAAAVPGESDLTPTDAARDVHIRARSRPAAKEESLLVRHSNAPSGHACDVLYISGNKLKEHVVPAVAQIRSVFGGGSSQGGRSVF